MKLRFFWPFAERRFPEVCIILGSLVFTMGLHADEERPVIEFDNLPLAGIPLEAALQAYKPEFVRQNKKFHSIVDGKIKRVRIRYMDDRTWKKKENVQTYLGKILTNEKHEAYGSQIWSQGVHLPEIECVIEFTEEHIAEFREKRVRSYREGVLLLWESVACYRDATGKWWFVSLFDEYHRSHPNGSRELSK